MPTRTQYQLVPNFTMYITKRSMQAKKVKVDFINTHKKYMPRMQWQLIDAFVDETD